MKSLRSTTKTLFISVLSMILVVQTLLLLPSPVQAETTNHTVSIDPNVVVQEDFLGVGVNLIPASFMEGTAQYGYNEAHWEMDRKRINMMQPKVARVWFQIDWMEPTKGNYTWDSPKMLMFYKYLDALQEAGTEIEFNFGWKVGVDTQSWFSIPGVDGRISAPADLDAYANSTSAVLNELINNRGYTNIKYLTFYNEPNGNWDFESLGDQKAYFATMVQKASDQLTADGLRDLVEIWGPEESGDPSWTQYMKDNIDSHIDAYTFHVYGQSYDGLSKSITDRTSVVGDKPVVMTEFGFAEDKSSWSSGLAGSVIKAANEGLHGALIWQLNGVWLPDPYVGNDTNGNYTLWDSVVLGTAPYKRYYESSLLTRYIPAHSTVVSVDTGSPDLRGAAFKTAGGDYTIVLETNEGSDRSVTLDFNGIDIGKTFYKHVYQADVSLEGNAIIPPASASFPAGASLTDSSIDANHNVIVYTTLAPQTQVAITPLEPVMTGGETAQLNATVIDHTGGVTWSLEGSENGTITSEGLYTAPQVTAETLIAVKATSIDDPSGYGIALVKVRPASSPDRVDIPLLGLAPGKYASAEAVTITTSTADATIRYTTDGSIPTEASEIYAEPIFLIQGKTTRIKAIAFKEGLIPSAEAYGLYKIADISSGPDGYQFCAYEDGFDCSFDGTASVAFGSDGLFNYATLTDGTACSSAIFGDPNPGQPKRCYYNYDIPSENPVVTIYNAGFENPVTTNYRTGPMTNGWAFNYRSGVQHNGSAFGAPLAPEGDQTAFMVSRAGLSGELIQSMNFKEGTYTLSFQMAKRTTFGETLPFDIYFDETLIGSYEPSTENFTIYKTDSFIASAGYHTIKFIGEVTTAESTAFIDDVQIQLVLPPNPLLNVIVNAGFEEPSMVNSLTGPMTHGWTFNAESGIQKNGGQFGPGQAPEGEQSAFLRSKDGEHGEISQSVEFEPGHYILSFQAAERRGNQSFDVFYDDTLIGSYDPTSSDFKTFTTDRFLFTAGSHTIKFVGTSTSGDNTSFIDDVKLILIALQGPPMEPSDMDVANAGFEAPSTLTYTKGPMTHDWTFNERAGVQMNGSILGAAAAPEGIQTAFLQSVDGEHGEISQSVQFEAGTYTLSFHAAKQMNASETVTINVYYDDTLMGSYAPTAGNFTTYTTGNITASEGNHTIKFVGTSSTGDHTAFIDAVTFTLIPPEEPASKVLLNASFESPNTVNYLKGPMTHDWTFNERAGIQTNGSVFNPQPAPDGFQTAFLQSVNGVHGEISQTIDFEAGDYQIDFQAAKRTSSGGTLSFNVYLDDTLIGSYAPSLGSFTSYTTDSFTVEAGNHTIKFVGMNMTGDNTAFIDAVTIHIALPQEPAPIVLNNAGFETPSIPNYLKGPMTHGWTFNSRTGIQKNGGVFGAEAAPEGVQTAFLQSVNGDHGEISQTVHFDAGTYTISFQAAKRTTAGGTQSFDVYMDDTVIGSYMPTSGSFISYTTDSFTATTGNHTIKFVGTSTVGDNMDFIDAVTIQIE